MRTCNECIHFSVPNNCPEFWGVCAKDMKPGDGFMNHLKSVKFHSRDTSRYEWKKQACCVPLGSVVKNEAEEEKLYEENRPSDLFKLTSEDLETINIDVNNGMSVADAHKKAREARKIQR